MSKQVVFTGDLQDLDSCIDAIKVLDGGVCVDKFHVFSEDAKKNDICECGGQLYER